MVYRLNLGVQPMLGRAMDLYHLHIHDYNFALRCFGSDSLLLNRHDPRRSDSGDMLTDGVFAR